MFLELLGISALIAAALTDDDQTGEYPSPNDDDIDNDPKPDGGSGGISTW